MVLSIATDEMSTLAQFQQVLEEIGPDSCPTHYNFHLHTVHSDGQLRPDRLVDQAISLGLEGFAITDHHTVDGYYVAQEMLGSDRPCLWVGVELTTQLLGCEAHILGYGFEPKDPALLPFLTGKAVPDLAAEDAIRALHQAGGMAVLAHPFRYTRSEEEMVAAAIAAGIDGLEVYYSYRNPDPWIPSPEQTQAAERLAADYGLYRTCGTDTHGLDILRRI